MKFNFVTPAFLGPINDFKGVSNYELIGGAEIYLYDLSKILLNKGHEVTVVQPMQETSTFDFNGIKIRGVKLPNRLNNDLEFSYLWPKNIDDDADIVHLHTLDQAFPFGNENLSGTCHGIVWDCPEMDKSNKYTNYEKYTPRLKRSFLKYQVRYAIRKLKKIASVDTFLLKYVQSEMPEYRDKINVIPNYVDTSTFYPRSERHPKLANYMDRLLILFPRNITFNRGIHLILPAINLLKDKYPEILLILTGIGPQESYAKDFIQRNSLENYVVSLGHVDHYRDMPLLYASADMVVIPSFCHEGTSLSCLESMAHRKPTIASNIGGLTDIIINEYNGLIHKPDAKSLAECISLLIEDANKCKEISNNGLRWVKEMHAYEKWCSSYERFFEL